MNRLSEENFAPTNADPKTFKRCWVCGKEDDDICEFRMWQECDDSDKPEERFIIMCRSKECRSILNRHERLYIEVDWACQETGKFMLVCSECEQRKGFDCTDPRAKKNGGTGLQCYRGSSLNAIVCTDKGCFPMRSPIVKCEGFKERQGK